MSGKVSSWPQVKLGDVCDILTGYPFKSNQYSDAPDDVLLLRGDNIAQGYLRWGGAKRWPSSLQEGVHNYSLRAGDVVLAMDRPWIEAGLKYGVINKNDLPALLVQRVARLRGGPKLDTRYLRYIIGSRGFTEYILAIQTGTAVPHISKEQIGSFTFHLPPLDEQIRVVNVLGSLDDKVELNNRMNGTMDTIARLIFQSWFIDFDPVRAKAEGKQPYGMDKETAALFPSEFEDSELGEIPKGWEIKKIDDLCSVIRETVNPQDNPDETFEHYSIPAFDNGRNPILEKGAIIKSNKGLIVPGCILLSKLNPSTPRVWFPSIRKEVRSICSTEFIILAPRDGLTPEFLYALFNSDSFFREFRLKVTGTSSSHQRVRREDLGPMEIVLPPIPLIKSFSDLVNPMYELISRNKIQAQILVEIRDVLIPRLISGEIRTPIDKFSNLQAMPGVSAPTE